MTAGLEIVSEHVASPRSPGRARWRASAWPDGVYSVARFELEADDSGTQVVFDHTGFPDDQRDHLAAGWDANYWEPLARHLSER